MLKFISWNIDSLNAALTSDSPRAQLSRDVLSSLAEQDADLRHTGNKTAGCGTCQETHGSPDFFIPRLPCRVGELGAARQKGLRRNYDPLQRSDQGRKNSAKDRRAEHHG